MGRIEADGRAARHFASEPNILTSNVDTVRATLRAQGWIPGRNVMVFSDGDPALKGAVIRAARQQVTHVLDCWCVDGARRRRLCQKEIAGDRR